MSWFKPSPVHAAGLRLLAAVSATARQEALYGDDCTPDTMAGRFEMLALFGGLAILRLRASPNAERVAQSFVDSFFKHIDAGLREAGVGDLTVPKKMKAIAGAVYGRLGAYEDALAKEGEAALEAVLVRNVWSGTASPFAAPLARYVRQVWVALAAADVSALEVQQTWPQLR